MPFVIGCLESHSGVGGDDGSQSAEAVSFGGRGRRLDVALVLLAALVVAMPAIGQVFSHRLVGTELDLDGDGQTDQIASYAYDAAGRLETVSIAYTGDGTPDLWPDVDPAAYEFTFSYDAAGRIDSGVLERTEGTETTTYVFDYTFVDDRLSWISQTIPPEQHIGFDTIFRYTGPLLDRIEYWWGFLGDGPIALSEHVYTWGDDGLPASVTTTQDASFSGTIETGLLWRDDGQIGSITYSISTSSTPDAATGSGTYVYDDEGKIEEEIWIYATPLPGLERRTFAEIEARSYTKTSTYDAGDLLSVESYDLGSDGSLDTVRTHTWEVGSCVPTFLHGEFGLPNFAPTDERPWWIPGTGATSLRHCGPTLLGTGAPPVPSSSLPVALLLATLLVALAVPSARYRAGHARIRT